MLVDDWENVTKNQQVVPLPHPHPVDQILDDYLAYERPHRDPGSASLDILDETIAGLREYFDKCLGRILLYRYVIFNPDLCSERRVLTNPASFERQQYIELYKQWQAAKSEDKHKSAVDTYGPEHLCRLLGEFLISSIHLQQSADIKPTVTMPELVAQTNMDQQSVNRLREELLKFSNWLSKHGIKYFVSEYEAPDAEYIEKARGT